MTLSQKFIMLVGSQIPSVVQLKPNQEKFEYTDSILCESGGTGSV